jgi:hypothetical protein
VQLISFDALTNIGPFDLKIEGAPAVSASSSSSSSSCLILLTFGC